MKQHKGYKGKYIICLILVLVGSMLCANVALAGGVSVELSQPAESQAFRPGDTVTITGTALGLTEVTVSVYNSAAASVYYAQLAVNEGQFTTQFTLQSNAVEGTYRVRIGGLGLTAPYERYFQVQQNTSSPSVTVIQPTLNQIFNPGNTVNISGTALNLAEVSIAVYNSAAASLYTAQPAVTGGQFSTSFTLPGDAITGTYTLRIGGSGLTTVERIFLVQPGSSSPAVTVTLPTENQIYYPGDTITINGTAQNLSEVTVAILDNSNNFIYSTPLTVTGGQFSTSYILPAEATVGTYKIQINGQGLSSAFERSVTVQTSTDNCFIATAAYGSKFQPSVALLRQFRDHFLMTSEWGRAFVAFYYKNSPPIASYIAGSESLKAIVRLLLTPAVGVAYLMLHPKLMYPLLLILFAAVLWRIKQKRIPV